MQTRNPSPTEVRSIFSDTYNFYTKWIAVKEIDWDLLLSESHEIELRYPFELTVKMLVELITIIETNYISQMEENNNGS